MMRFTSFFTVMVVAIALTSSASARWAEIAYTGTLSNTQVVPDVPASNNWGAAICILDRNVEPHTLDCELQHTILRGDRIQSIVIGRGARGTAGPAVFTFTGTMSDNVRNVFELKAQEDYSIDQMEDDFLNGRWYIQVNTQFRRNGEIRAQLEHQNTVYARLSAEDTIPISSGSNIAGILLGTYGFTYTEISPLRLLSVDVVHDVQSPTGASLHYGTYGFVGPTYKTLLGFRSPTFERIVYSEEADELLWEEAQYYQVESRANPSGAIRGQFVTIDSPRDVAFSARLLPDDDNNEERGCAIVAYDCSTRLLEYLVIHTIENPIVAYVAAGVSSRPEFALARSKNPILGQKTLSEREEYLLYSQQLFIVVASTNDPTRGGEISGRLGVQDDFYAYLSGTKVVPPVTTSAMGCGLFHLSDNNRKLHSYILHTVENPISLEMWYGNVMQNGVRNRSFRNRRQSQLDQTTFYSDDDGVMDDDDLQEFATDGAYIQVNSLSHQFAGEVRGQIYRLHPCSADSRSVLTEEDD